MCTYAHVTMYNYVCIDLCMYLDMQMDILVVYILVIFMYVHMDVRDSRLSRSRYCHKHSALSPLGLQAPRQQQPGWLSGVSLKCQAVLLSLLSAFIPTVLLSLWKEMWPSAWASGS